MSPVAEGVTLAQQMGQQGHDVLIHIIEKNYRPVFDGLIWKSDDWEKDAKQADLVVFDDNGHGAKADRLRAQGIHVWNGGVLADRLEHDRAFGMKVFEKAGIPIPETYHFSSAGEALKLIKEHFRGRDRLVVKLNDSGSATSYVAKDVEDAVLCIETWEKEGQANLAKGGILQRFVEGCELSIEGWFNGERFAYPFNWTMEDKKLLDGNLGPNVGCAFNICGQWRERVPRMAKELLLPLIPLLKKGGYTGQIDVNTIVSYDDKSFYALEYTPRPGFDATPTLVQGLPGYAEAIVAAMKGEDMTKGAEAPFDFLAGVRAWIPPYPFEAQDDTLTRDVYKTVEGVAIEGWDPENRSFLLYDAKLEDEKLICAGTSGMIGIGLGKGRTVEAATAACYTAVEKIHAPNLAYRTDGGERVKEALPFLRRAGIL